MQCGDVRPQKSFSKFRHWFYGLTVEDDAGFEEGVLL